ncbi:hypothetical protein [Halobacteriovorax sp. CON-3]|uniref:hypothetical protein n=1 Tax=Halobacteriovorax sp. CON-3 TaxID=3157710 RepID=UPI00371520C4
MKSIIFFTENKKTLKNVTSHTFDFRGILSGKAVEKMNLTFKEAPRDLPKGYYIFKLKDVEIENKIGHAIVHEYKFFEE